jgi:hypothetical protein
MARGSTASLAIAERIVKLVDMISLAFSLAPGQHDTVGERKSADLGAIFPGGW